MTILAAPCCSCIIIWMADEKGIKGSGMLRGLTSCQCGATARERCILLYDCPKRCLFGLPVSHSLWYVPKVSLLSCTNGLEQLLTDSALCLSLAQLDWDRNSCPLVRPPLQHWSRFRLNQPKCGWIVRPRKSSSCKQKTSHVKQAVYFIPNIPANIAYLLTHTTKRCQKHSRLIIKNLVGRGNQTPDYYYNDSMTIMPLAQTGCST